MKTVIVGAGLTGLILGNNLFGEITIIEKSRGVGGRMATRRTDTSRFDHGAQFYAHREPLELFHQKWLTKDLTRPWFERKGVQHFNAPNGMTALAKSLAEGLDIHFEKRAESITHDKLGWKLCLESGDKISCDRLILTAPLPQCLEILKRSSINYDGKLDEIEYSKALVALIELDKPSRPLSGETGYQEFQQGAVFSIADQRIKEVSPVPSLTVTLSAEMSGRLYEASDDAVIEVIRHEIGCFDSGAILKTIQIKRWKYNMPVTTFGASFCEITPSLLLAGDAFGGASLNGAARSANALCKYLAG